MKEKTFEKLQNKIRVLKQENEQLKEDLHYVNSLNLEYKKVGIKAMEESDLYKNLWITSKNFIQELLKNNPKLN